MYLCVNKYEHKSLYFTEFDDDNSRSSLLSLVDSTLFKYLFTLMLYFSIRCTLLLVDKPLFCEVKIIRKSYFTDLKRKLTLLVQIFIFFIFVNLHIAMNTYFSYESDSWSVLRKGAIEAFTPGRQSFKNLIFSFLRTNIIYGIIKIN